MNKIEIRNAAKAIRARNEAIDALEKQVLSKGNEWLCEIRLQGAELVKAKHDVGHGNWLAFLEECGLSETTARRRMLIASNSSRVTNLDAAGSLRQALAICGAPVEPGDHSDKEPHRWPGPIEAIARASKFIGYVDRFPIASWPKPQVEKLREDLKPIAEKLWPEKFA